jgi:hypothetical protein
MFDEIEALTLGANNYQPISCSSVSSAPPPAKWGNSVLNVVFCPRDQLQDLPALLWDVGLS